MNPQPNNLRRNRLGTGLTQDEVSFLLGTSSGARVSRYESFKRLPELNVVLAYAAIHQRPIQELFEGKYQEVTASVLTRAKELRDMLKDDPKERRKVEILNAMILVLERGFDLHE